jgi:tRNA modification GTPase
MELAREQLAAADCRVIVLDASRPPHDDDFRLLANWPDALVVANKCDLPNAWDAALPTGAMLVSAVSGAGVSDLAAQIVSRLVPEVPAAGMAVPVSRRQVERLHASHAAVTRGSQTEFTRAWHELLTTPAHVPGEIPG